MSISLGMRHLPLATAATVATALAGSAGAAVQSFAVNWSLPASGDLYVTLNNVNLSTAPSTSSTAVTGWDMRISSPANRASLEFSFPPATAPGSNGSPNAWYGIMRAPGTMSGSGASLPMGALVSLSGSFADSGSVAFGSGSYQWQLNGANMFGFRMKHPTVNGALYGWARIVVGSTPGQFTITHFAYENATGAAIAVGAGMPIPGPGVAAAFAAAGLVGRRRRR